MMTDGDGLGVPGVGCGGGASPRGGAGRENKVEVKCRMGISYWEEQKGYVVAQTEKGERKRQRGREKWGGEEEGEREIRVYSPVYSVCPSGDYVHKTN